MEYYLNKKYTRGEIAYYFAECARKIGENVKDRKLEKNILFDAAIVEFINTISGCDFAMYTTDMYNNNFRSENHFNVPLISDVKNIALKAKQIYLWEIASSGNKTNTPRKATKLNKHMHEDISGIKFTDADIIQCIDNFLTTACEFKGVKIKQQELNEVKIIVEPVKAGSLEANINNN